MFTVRYWCPKRRPIITTMIVAIFCMTLYILTQQQGNAITLTSMIRKVTDTQNTAPKADDRQYIHEYVFSPNNKLNRNLKHLHYKQTSGHDNTRRVSIEEFSKTRLVSDDNSRDKIYVDDELSDYRGEYSQNLVDTVYNSSLQKIQENATRRLPQAIIIGVKKCGTRALLEFLRLHPDIRSPGPEPHFFDRHYDNGLEWYREKMPPTLEGQITMEKTPSYFVTKEVPARIMKMSKDTKLIVVVRNPVTRAISDYTQAKVKRPVLPSFEELVFMNNNSRVVDTSWGAIKIGVYSKHLENWLRYFPVEQFHFVSGENLISDPAGELAKVQDFLGIKRIISNKHFYFNETRGFPCLKKPEGSGRPHCLGKSKGRQHPFVNPTTMQRLKDFYRPFNAKFYQMVKQSFGW